MTTRTIPAMLADCTIILLLAIPLALAALVRWARGHVPVLVAALALTATLPSCGGPPRAASDVVRVSAVAVEATDAAFQVAYMAAGERALEDAEDLAGYEARMAPWRVTERAIGHARGLVVVLSATLEAWRAGAADERTFVGVVACLVPALEAIVAALEQHDIDVSEVRTFLVLARPFGAALCGAPS